MDFFLYILDLNWGTSIQAQTFSDALTALQSLATQSIHVKNYRPQILCLTGFPNARPALVDFANLLTKKQSLLICANINEDRVQSFLRRVIIQNGYEWLQARNVKAFYVMVDSCKFDEGCQALLQSTGIGKLAPNILLLGYKGKNQTFTECPKKLTHLFTEYFILYNFVSIQSRIVSLKGVSSILSWGALGNVSGLLGHF